MVISCCGPKVTFEYVKQGQVSGIFSLLKKKRQRCLKVCSFKSKIHHYTGSWLPFRMVEMRLLLSRVIQLHREQVQHQQLQQPLQVHVAGATSADRRVGLLIGVQDF